MKNLNIIRKQRGFNQLDVAKYIGVDRTTYSNYETGKRDPDTDTVVKLANLFDVTTDYLLGNTDDPTPPFKAPETFLTIPMAPPPEKGQKKEAPPISLEKMEELYIQMLAEEEGTTIDKLNLSEERRNILHKLILSLLAE